MEGITGGIQCEAFVDLRWSAVSEVAKCQTRSTPGVGDPKKYGLYKGRLANKVWLFLTFFVLFCTFSVSRKNLNQTDRENLNRTDLSNRSMSPSRSLICKRKPIAAKEPS